MRASPREQEAKITADVFVASLRVFCGPRDFLDLDVILNSFVPGRVRKSKSELALTSEAAAAAAEPADNSFELKLHIHETVVALTYGDFDSPPLAGEANAFLSGDDAIRGVTYLKTTLRKTTVNFRKSGDAGSSQDAASVVVVGVDISEVWAGGEGAQVQVAQKARHRLRYAGEDGRQAGDDLWSLHHGGIELATPRPEANGSGSGRADKRQRWREPRRGTNTGGRKCEGYGGPSLRCPHPTDRGMGGGGVGAVAADEVAGQTHPARQPPAQ